jgi:hypothetical protein
VTHAAFTSRWAALGAALLQVERTMLAIAAYVLLVGAGWIGLAVYFEERVRGIPHDGQAFLGFWIFGLVAVAIGGVATLVLLLLVRRHGPGLPLLMATIFAAVAIAVDAVQPFVTFEFEGRTGVQGPSEGVFVAVVLAGIALLPAVIVVVGRSAPSRQGHVV